MIATHITHGRGVAVVPIEYHGEKVFYDPTTATVTVMSPVMREQVPVPEGSPEGTEPTWRHYFGEVMYTTLLNTDELTIEPCGAECIAGHKDEKKYLD